MNLDMNAERLTERIEKLRNQLGPGGRTELDALLMDFAVYVYALNLPSVVRDYPEYVMRTYGELLPPHRRH